MLAFVLGSLSLSALISSVRADYSLEVAYQGESFFEGWDYWGNRDNLTNGALLAALLRSPRQLTLCSAAGAVYYVAKGESSDFAYTNSAGNAIIKVDNET
jgi:hypothetical protein